MLVHVDDVAIYSNKSNVSWFKSTLKADFSCKDEAMERYLGFDVTRTDDGFLFSQSRLIKQLGARANRCRGNTPNKITPIRNKPKLEKPLLSPGDRAELKNYPYRSNLGVTGYAVVGTRPDGAFAYKTLASFNDCHQKPHREALDDFISYLDLTAEALPLKLSKSGGDSLSAYCDADWNGTECH